MSILAFQMPEKVTMEKADDFHGLFHFQTIGTRIWSYNR
jgi:DNA-directed RNA polymerase subunit alpha